MRLPANLPDLPEQHPHEVEFMVRRECWCVRGSIPCGVENRFFAYVHAGPPVHDTILNPPRHAASVTSQPRVIHNVSSEISLVADPGVASLEGTRDCRQKKRDEGKAMRLARRKRRDAVDRAGMKTLVGAGVSFTISIQGDAVCAIIPGVAEKSTFKCTFLCHNIV